MRWISNLCVIIHFKREWKCNLLFHSCLINIYQPTKWSTSAFLDFFIHQISWQHIQSFITIGITKIISSSQKMKSPVLIPIFIETIILKMRISHKNRIPVSKDSLLRFGVSDRGSAVERKDSHSISFFSSFQMEYCMTKLWKGLGKKLSPHFLHLLFFLPSVHLTLFCLLFCYLISFLDMKHVFFLDWKTL